jgi:hypothetical protein
MDEFSELQDWYAAHCNGEWEHQHGVVIESLDNPGWWVKIGKAKFAGRLPADASRCLPLFAALSVRHLGYWRRETKNVNGTKT